jgi:D-alanine-D-alanine ligase
MLKKVAVVMGGYSSEYEVSLRSGTVVCKHIDSSKYDIYPVHILKEKWVYVNEQGQEFPIDRSDFSVVIAGNKITFDVVFNVIHGHPGEDGVLPAYFELLGIPHTSDNSYKMALTFNKRDCLSVLDAYHIPHAKSFYLNKGEPIDIESIIKTVGLPCFVKANRAGSSFGITKVNEKAAMLQAIEHAFKEDSQLLIEEFLSGTEVSVGVVTYKGKVRVLPITEIVSENEYFDYEAKYLGKSQEITPARISTEQESTVRHLAEKVYRALDMKGMTRSEYIFKNGTPHLLEVNTIPGITEASILPQQLMNDGITIQAFFSDLIESALKKNFD